MVEEKNGKLQDVILCSKAIIVTLRVLEREGKLRFKNEHDEGKMLQKILEELDQNPPKVYVENSGGTKNGFHFEF